VSRIGFVSPISRGPTIAAFLLGLKDLGYVEGTNVVIEARFAEGRIERLPELVAEVLRLKVDVLVAGSPDGALAAKRATTTVPVVFAGVTDPVTAGIVPSLARPGANITGVTWGIGGVGFAAKWVELLKEAVPGLSHLAALTNPAGPLGAQYAREIRQAARALNVTVDLLDAGSPPSLDRALAAIGTSGAQGIVVTGDPFFIANRGKLVRFAASKRLPAVYFSKLFTDAGGLMAYSGSLEESYRRAATYVDKILKGAKPADLPIEQPTRFELLINLRTARALELTIPHSLRARADQVIE
jgi:putative ABC transport system substrate-binding protein